MIWQGEDFPTLTEEQRISLERLKEIYLFWNERINVISRKDLDNFFIHHVLHSLAIAKVFSFQAHSTIMDLGCGGGFPGIPLAIYFPEVHFHLVDSIAKKIKVVDEVAKELSLQNVSAEQIRAEDIRNQKFNGVISRAVAPLKDLWKWSAPLLLQKKEPYYGLICLKGGDLSREIHDVRKKVHQWEIHKKIFRDDWFENKYVLQVKG